MASMHKLSLFAALALLLALAPMFVFYVTPLSAPVVLYYVIRYRNAPMGLTQRSLVKLYIAGLIALLQIGGWVAIIIAIVSG